MVTMYDSVNVVELPTAAQAVAGYVNGKWPTYWTLVTRFPAARKLSIAVSADRDADCLDVEQGDATPDQAPGWVKRQIARGVVRPVVYTSVSQAVVLLDDLARHGVKRSQVRLWTAHYTHKPHLCDSSCWHGFRGRADATQYTDRALGRNLDASLCSDGFFAPPPGPSTRQQLRALILRWHRHGVPWVRVKATKAWRRFRALGGR
jgi:hypothetical protein